MFEGQVIEAQEIIQSALRENATKADLLKATDKVNDLRQTHQVSKIIGGVDNLDEIEDALKVAIKSQENAGKIDSVAKTRLANNIKSFGAKTSDFLSNALLVYEGAVLLDKAANDELKLSDFERYSHAAGIALVGSNSIKKQPGVAAMLGLAKLTIGTVELFTGSMRA